MHRVLGWLPTLARRRSIQPEFPGRIVVVGGSLWPRDSGGRSMLRDRVKRAAIRPAAEPWHSHSMPSGTKERGRQWWQPVFVTEILMSLSRRGSIIAAL